MFWKHNILGISWALFILVLCGLPGEQFNRSSSFNNADKVVHVFLFAILFFQLSVGFIKQRKYQSLRRHTLRKVLVISFGYGLIIELLQGTVFIHRSIELSDMLFNAIGCFSGFGLFLAIYGRESYV